MSRYVRNNIAAMTGYTPGEQPQRDDVVKLNTNENPYPPSPAVLDAMAHITAEQLRRYPSPTAAAFREAAADVHGLTPANIIATNGGDELLRLLITTFVEPGAKIVTPQPTYSLYPVLAAIADCPIEQIDRDADWSLPDDFAQQVIDRDGKLALIVNPHAPSGQLTSGPKLRAIAEALQGQAVLVVDEAYVDFVDPEAGHDLLPMVREVENLVLLRSMSKGYSLAGLRMGYGVAHETLIEPMMSKTKDSYNVDAVAHALATAAIRDRAYALHSAMKVREQRAWLRDQLGALGWAVGESASNFLLATVPENFAGGAMAVYEALKSEGIFVRYFDQQRLHDKLRITVGTAPQNRRLIEALQRMA